ncbi:MAG: hypothetical protein HC904_05755 [Blastochloris sp.]|nr:hypothetical protein [Blastochloris sp.]
MKFNKDNLNDEIILRLKDAEYTALMGALRFSANDIKTKNTDFVLIYGVERGDVISLCNEMIKNEGR